MRRGLRLYQDYYQQLDDEFLTWESFKSRADSILSDARSSLEEDELPWSPEDVIAAFVSVISKKRNGASAAWIESLESEAANLGTMPAASASRLNDRASQWPALLTQPHIERAKALNF